MIDIKDIVTLDNQYKYVVISKALYENKNYYFLINENNLEDSKIVIEKEKNVLSLVEDDNILNIIIPLFITETNKYLTDEEKKIINDFNGILKEKIEEN